VSKRIQVLERAMNLLATFDENHQEMGVTELADRLGLHKATVHRILRTLEKGGFIQQNSENGKYHLGWQLIPLGTLALQHFDLRRLASDLMQLLLEEHQETVDMAIYESREMYYIEVLESPQPVKIAARPGRGLPIHCTATDGRANSEDLEPIPPSTRHLCPLRTTTLERGSTPQDLRHNFHNSKNQRSRSKGLAHTP